MGGARAGGARFGGGARVGGARFVGGGGWGGGGGGHHHRRRRFHGGFGPGAWRGYWGRPYWNYGYPWYEETPTYFVRSRIGGQVWADDIGYTWADAVRVAATKAASVPPRTPGDYIEVMLANGTTACSFTAAGGRWVSSCGDLAFGAADSPPSAGTWLAVGAIAVGLWMYFDQPVSSYRS